MDRVTAATGGDTMTTDNPTADQDLRRRLAELEAENQRLREDRDRFKDAAYAFLDQIMPYKPVTPEEEHDMLHGPRGEQIVDVIAEMEAHPERKRVG
jgi:hypothetical protein